MLKNKLTREEAEILFRALSHARALLANDAIVVPESFRANWERQFCAALDIVDKHRPEGDARCPACGNRTVRTTTEGNTHCYNVRCRASHIMVCGGFSDFCEEVDNQELYQF